MRRREGEEREKEVTSTWTTACLCLLKAHKSLPSRASFWCCRPPSCRTAPASGFLPRGRRGGSADRRASTGPRAERVKGESGSKKGDSRWLPQLTEGYKFSQFLRSLATFGVFVAETDPQINTYSDRFCQ